MSSSEFYVDVWAFTSTSESLTSTCGILTSTSERRRILIQTACHTGAIGCQNSGRIQALSGVKDRCTSLFVQTHNEGGPAVAYN